jgi:arylformamidase
VYPASKPLSKTLIFIHGGYWHLLNKTLFHFIASGFHAYGVTTVLLTYPLAPHVTIDQIVLSCRKAILWLFGNVQAFNGDPHQMYVAGHSAGGHLAAMLIATRWNDFDAAIPANMLKGACCVSGLFNLFPIHLSYLNTVLKIDKETALRNSPVKLEPLNACPVIVAVGENETTEFHDQSKEIVACWKDKGTDCQLLTLPGKNHFSIVEAMVDSNTALYTAICQLMEIHR